MYVCIYICTYIYFIYIYYICRAEHKKNIYIYLKKNIYIIYVGRSTRSEHLPDPWGDMQALLEEGRRLGGTHFLVSFFNGPYAGPA